MRGELEGAADLGPADRLVREFLLCVVSAQLNDTLQALTPPLLHLLLLTGKVEVESDAGDDEERSRLEREGLGRESATVEQAQR